VFEASRLEPEKRVAKASSRTIAAIASNGNQVAKRCIARSLPNLSYSIVPNLPKALGKTIMVVFGAVKFLTIPKTTANKKGKALAALPFIFS
jgi:hypothetical protein